MISRQTLALAAALCALAIAGCSRSAKEPTAVETNVVEAAPAEKPRVAPDAPVQSANAAAAIDSNATSPEPPAVAQAPDEQMLDDATASGMTTRSSRGEEAANDADLPSPSEQK